VDDISDSVNSSGYGYQDYSNPYQNPETPYSNPDVASDHNASGASVSTSETPADAPKPEAIQKPKRKYKPRSKPKPEGDGTQPELGIS
jgi:hypothetical protein